ncbi:hypothetical protein [Halobacteriovorax sp. HLS]|uniref:hypothetical protein n=1 Tax=Halobacteriovorax sp. HLS TaxID=2234000 RepID=UPI000FDAD64E|nr:hypothetical protein [Halobacteriovorax sp. HLS]
MKYIVTFLVLVLLSVPSKASNCEEMTYTKEWIDYDSSWNDSCKRFILAAMKVNGCEVSNTYFSPVRMTELKSGSELMCIYKAKNGVYQVMASQMAEPHRAVVIFSRWD